MQISGKVMLITGASSGIGRALALLAAQKGAYVGLLARREEPLREAVQKIEDQGGKAVALKADVSNDEDVERAVKSTVERFGSLDILVNNAGLGYFGPVETMSLDDLDRILQVNVYGIVRMVKTCLPYLKKSKGIVLNISSGLSKRALPYLAAYAGSKAMVDALSDALRLELEEYGIKVLNYGPPETRTGFHQNTLTAQGFDFKDLSFGRKMASAEEVAQRLLLVITAEKREVNEGRILQVMNLLAPRFLDRIFARMFQRILQQTNEKESKGP